MTAQEAEDIVDIMQRHWPNWLFDGEELRCWLHQLRQYDYQRARAAINNLYMSREKPGKPPAGLVVRVLKATRTKSKKDNEPRLLYEVIKHGRVMGQRFYGTPGQLANTGGLEAESENRRQEFDNFYGGKHHIVRHWEPIPF